MHIVVKFPKTLSFCFQEECKFEREESRSEEMQRRSRVLSEQQVEMAEKMKKVQKVEMVAEKETSPEPRCNCHQSHDIVLESSSMTTKKHFIQEFLCGITDIIFVNVF